MIRSARECCPIRSPRPKIHNNKTTYTAVIVPRTFVLPDRCTVVKRCLLLSTSMININSTFLTLYNTIPTFIDHEKEAFRKHYGKGENAGNQHFLLFPQCFLPIYPSQKQFLFLSYVYFVVCKCFQFGPV